ncbi:unnamed protein product, partial [Ectocarpus sp. 12 AP-2014]
MSTCFSWGMLGSQNKTVTGISFRARSKRKKPDSSYSDFLTTLRLFVLCTNSSTLLPGESRTTTTKGTLLPDRPRTTNERMPLTALLCLIQSGGHARTSKYSPT